MLVPIPHPLRLFWGPPPPQTVSACSGGGQSPGSGRGYLGTRAGERRHFWKHSYSLCFMMFKPWEPEGTTARFPGTVETQTNCSCGALGAQQGGFLDRSRCGLRGGPAGARGTESRGDDSVGAGEGRPGTGQAELKSRDPRTPSAHCFLAALPSARGTPARRSLVPRTCPRSVSAHSVLEQALGQETSMPKAGQRGMHRGGASCEPALCRVRSAQK